MSNDKILNVKEIAKMIDISEWTIRKYFREGKLKGKKLLSGWGTTKKNVDAFKKKFMQID